MRGHWWAVNLRGEVAGDHLVEWVAKDLAERMQLQEPEAGWKAVKKED